MALSNQLLKTSTSGGSTTSPGTYHPHSEEVFANALCYTIWHCQEECNPGIFVATLQDAIKLPLSLLFSMLNEPTLPLRLLRYMVLQDPDLLSSLLLETLQFLCRSLAGRWGAILGKVFGYGLTVTKDGNNFP